jgi:hypothetical protein
MMVAACLGFAATGPVAVAAGATKTVLLVAGKPSHGPGEHEFNAGIQLLNQCLAGVPGLKTEMVLNAGPIDPAAMARADAVIVYSDGEFENKHPALMPENFAHFQALAARGGGIGFLHYAVEPSVTKGRPEFLQWIGGEFEINRSVKPHWDATFRELPSHPITRGVHPFTQRDEWYFNLRFAGAGQDQLTPLLVDVPPPETMSRADGKHEGNPGVRAIVARHEPQTVAWAFERPDGGRGFGFTGGHFHKNWGNDDARKLVLNAVLWLAKMEVPADGVASSVSAADLAEHLDPKPAPKKK